MDEEEYSDEGKWQAFLHASKLMQATALWLEEYGTFGDGLDSPLEFQDYPEQ